MPTVSRLIALACLLVLALPGQAADPSDPYQGSGGRFLGTPSSAPSYNAEHFARFELGRTTKAEVVSSLGKPAGWTTLPDGTSQLQYTYFGASSVAGGMRLKRVIYATFTFDSAHVLVKADYPKSP